MPEDFSMKAKIIFVFVQMLIFAFSTFSCGGNGGEESSASDPEAGTFSISQFGITWHFDKELVSGTDYGQFANSDYWAESYDATLNVGIGISSSSPLQIIPNTSLISAISQSRIPTKPNFSRKAF
jgi:hypothetical protein